MAKPEVIEAEEVTDVVPHQSGMVRAVSGDVTEALVEYKKIQASLDEAMPDCIMNIQGKGFRKKMYWRAIARAFGLSLELLKEEKIEDGADWGYVVTYRACAAAGAFADGDGSCFASEKRSGNDSIHNVRSHAHTRAKNRAISDLVGFGEVSAEEMPHDGAQYAPSGRPPPPPTKTKATRGPTEKQLKRLYAIMRTKSEKTGVPFEDVSNAAKEVMVAFGCAHSNEMSRPQYDKLCDTIESWTLETFAGEPPSDADEAMLDD
jgi:hypothetical protein